MEEENLTSKLGKLLAWTIQYIVGIGILFVLLTGGVASLLMLRFYMPEVGVEIVNAVVILLGLLVRIIVFLIAAYLIYIASYWVSRSYSKKEVERKRLIKDIVSGLKKR